MPEIYHITHVDNLASIVAAGELWSDAVRIRHERFPWSLIDRVGVMDDGIAQQVRTVLGAGGARQVVEIRPQWYY